MTFIFPLPLENEPKHVPKSLSILFSNYISFHKSSLTHKTFLENLNSISILTNVFKTLSNKNWKQAMDTEMEALQKNKTWELALTAYAICCTLQYI